ncbi:hypothetical protein [Streptomyces paromomycinus]|nr:hypothetical protein [Streptomyces paromomycinus]
MVATKTPPGAVSHLPAAAFPPVTEDGLTALHLFLGTEIRACLW